jgi:aminopeptidase N
MVKQMKSLYLLSALFLFGCNHLKHSEEEIKPNNNHPKSIEFEETKEVEQTSILKERPRYHAARTIKTDLIHTKLEVRFDWSKTHLIGKASITAKPHFYATDSLFLDAKGMEIKSVLLNNTPLKFNYSNDVIAIQLDKKYTNTEKYTVVIDYVSKPEERETGGSAAITSDKGLYFINPTKDSTSKMPQIWTQGETESNSVWFPTIDSPNSKSTQEIWITTEPKNTTLSNGKLVKTIKNSDGTKTDVWKQELPHAPYLFMMAIGEFKVVKDTYKKPDGTLMEVNYYVEPEWEGDAKAIFGETPAMIAYFSKLLGVEYPWDKYHQIVVRDYVSGAMENTGAVIFGDYVYKNKRELLDENDQSTIAHELFHHWFGDLVTAESWSNLTLNESFANYSQYLWDEYRYGKDEAAYQAEIVEKNYYESAKAKGYHNLVWFDYETREDMFDAHSYNKGGRILHMLRSYLGDEAFFKGIQLYLTKNQFKAAEFHQLRLAFEEVCGEDLNWFFNQWYLGSAHPILDIKQKINASTNTIEITLEQSQNLELAPIFKLPMHVAIYDSLGKHIYPIVFDKINQSFTFPFNGGVNCVIVDDQQMLLAKKREEKPTSQYVFQYYNSKEYKTRFEGLVRGTEASPKIKDKLILDALNDSFWNIRLTAIQLSDRLSDGAKKEGIDRIKLMVTNDSKSQVREAGIQFLTKNVEPETAQLICKERIEKDSSYLVAGAVLVFLGQINPEEALVYARRLENESSSSLKLAIAQIYAGFGNVSEASFFQNALKSKRLNALDEIGVLSSYSMFLVRQDVVTISKAVPTYEYISKNGGYYSKMFFGQNIDYLQRHLTEKLVELNAMLSVYEKEKNEIEITKTKKEIVICEKLATDFDKFKQQ